LAEREYRARRLREGTRAPAKDRLLTEPQLAELLVHRVVNEVVIVEVEKEAYRIEILVTFKAKRQILATVRGEVRHYFDLGNAVNALKRAGIGRVNVRLELLN